VGVVLLCISLVLYRFITIYIKLFAYLCAGSPQVIAKEGLSTTKDGLEAIIFTADGDMRQALNNLQVRGTQPSSSSSACQLVHGLPPHHACLPATHPHCHRVNAHRAHEDRQAT
jgi:hypothetical protein